MNATPGRIAIVIVNYRTPDLALRAVTALETEHAAYPGLSVVLVDGGSDDGSSERLADGIRARGWQDWVTLLPLAINGGFGWANNQAIQYLLQSPDPPDYIHLLNPDTEAERGAVVNLAATLDADPRCAAAGSLLIEADGSPAGSAFHFHSIGTELIRASRTGLLARLFRVPPIAIPDCSAKTVDWVTGASVMFRAAALREVGLFDTGFFLYFEEVELMWRLRKAGWTIRHQPASRVHHVGGVSTGVDQVRAEAERPPLPDYWYASRKRMFALTLGRTKTLGASLTWLAGYTLFRARRLVDRRDKHPPTRAEARGLLRNGIIPTPHDLTPAVARWDDPLGIAPAWMKRT